MTTQHFALAYGERVQEFDLPQERIAQVVRAAKVEPLQAVEEAILDAVEHPIGCESLAARIKPGQKVAFICNDTTRVANSHVFMPLLVRYLEQLGIRTEDMLVLFALGTHRAMTPAEMEESIGSEVYHRVRTYNSLALESESFDYYGTTSRGTPVHIHKLLGSVDHIIMTGTVVHHYFSGYGGGRKAILPGCAAMETIRHNHSFMLEPTAELGHLEGNPCYDDQMEGVQLFAQGRSLFLLNVILDPQHRFLRAFAGDYHQAHLEACAFVNEVYGVRLAAPAELVIASCGGYPKDINVYQMQKTMDNAACAVKPGGVIILVAECREGSGSRVLEETFARLGTAEAIYQELKDNFVIGANKAFAITRLQQKAHYILVSELDPELGRHMLFDGVVKTVPEALRLAERFVSAESKIVVMPEGSLTVPSF